MIEIALLLITSIWVPDSSYNDNMEIEYGYRQVPINYLDIDEDPCDNPNMRACYMSQENPYIDFKKNDPLLFEKSKCGISSWDHEILHAWGISHTEMQLWFNPCIEFHESQKFPKFPTMNNEGFYFK
jgi:hypothetical protein